MNTATEAAKAPLTDSPKLYPLDQQEFEIEITAGKHKLFHKLRRPSEAELLQRESETAYETEAINDTEEKVNADDEAANARLWDKIAIEIKGYRKAGEPVTAADIWTPVADDWRAMIPASHKATAIRSLYQFTCELEQADDDGFVVGAETFTVKQTFGSADFPDYVVRHILKAPTESQRHEFRRKSADVRFTKGAKRMRTKVVTHLRAHIELYDALLTGLDGTNNEYPSPAAPKIDPIWKRSVIDALMRHFEASVGNS